MLEKAVRKYFVRGRERWDTNIGCMTHHARARAHTHTQIHTHMITYTCAGPGTQSAGRTWYRI